MERELVTPESYQPVMPNYIESNKLGENGAAVASERPVVDRLAFLARASEALSASLEHQATLQMAARIAVPFLADWCSIDILTAEGEVSRVASAHVDPERETLALELNARHRYDADALYGPPNVIRTGSAELYEDVTEEMIRTRIRDPERVNGLLRLGIRSALIVPMSARGRTLGAITFITDLSGRRLGAEDLALAQDLAARAAMAVDNARLYEAESVARSKAEAAESALREASAEAALLHRAGRLLGSTLDTQQVYSTLRELVAEIMDCDGLFVSTFDSDAQMIQCAFAWVEGQPIDPAGLPAVPLAPEGKGVQSQVIRTGEPLLISDMDDRMKLSHTSFHVNPDGSYDKKPADTGPRTQSAIYVPIKLEGQVLGTVQVQSLRRNAYTPDHLRMLEALMLQVAGAFRNAFLYQQVRAELEERTRAELELARRQADIESLNERLQRAMTETHHRVKNNLQIIAAMVDLQLMDRPESVPAGHVRRLGSYVMTLAAVHDILTEESKEDSQARFASARAVLQKLLPLLQQTAEGRRIIPTVQDVKISAKQGTAIALVVNELVNNAFKHGAQNVTIDLRQEGSDLRLAVCDDGPGFPPDFDASSTASTGLELVESLSRWDLQGSVRYENLTPDGACVTVTAPLALEFEPLLPEQLNV